MRGFFTLLTGVCGQGLGVRGQAFELRTGVWGRDFGLGVRGRGLFLDGVIDGLGLRA